MFKDLIGVPFEFGKTDCCWLVEEVYKRYGADLTVHHDARAAVECYNTENNIQWIERNLSRWRGTKQPSVPCLVALSLGGSGFINHVGVHIGDNKMIHTTKRIGSVVIESLDNPLYARRKYYTFNGD